MSKVSSDKIALIRSKVDIVTIIGNHLKLEKKGRNFWAVCPFHQDSHPSMSISSEKQIYRCFSCSASGNIFTFLQEYNNISFVQALQEAANLAGIPLDEIKNYEGQKYSSEALEIFEMNKIACQYFIYHLQSTQGLEAKKYLHQRNINDELINQFEIGLAPLKNKLLHFMKQRNYNEHQLLKAGLIKEHKSYFIDNFIDRIIFPIKDAEGNIIGFSGRVYHLDQEPKYFNTTETVVFKKNRLLYNFSNAKKMIRKDLNLIIVEGFLDVIALATININNVVAIMGTNFSSEHLKEIQKVTKEIILFFDGDEAGVKATINSCKNLLQQNINVKVVNNLWGLDPDDLVKKIGSEEVHGIIKNRLHPLDFIINYYQKMTDLTKVENIKNLLSIVKPILELLSNGIEIDYYVNKIHNLTMIDKKNIFEEKSDTVKPVIKEEIIKNEKFKIQKNFIYNSVQKAENFILFYLLQTREAVILAEQDQPYLQNKFKRILLKKILQWYYQNPHCNSINLKQFYEELTDNEKQIIININYIFNKFIFSKQSFLDCKIVIENDLINQEIIKLKKSQEIESDIIKQLAISDQILSLKQSIKKGEFIDENNEL